MLEQVVEAKHEARGLNPVPARPGTTSTKDVGNANLTPLPSKRPSPCNQGSATADYNAYLDSMLAHLGRVHTAATIRYHWRRLEEARAA